MSTDDFDKGYKDGFKEGEHDAREEVRRELVNSNKNVRYALAKELNYLELKFAGASDEKVLGYLEGYRDAVKKAKGAA